MRDSAAFVWLFVVFSSSLFASPKVDVSGFATVTAGYNSSDSIGFSPNYLNDTQTSWSLSRDSNLGLQLNTDISQQFDAVVQVVLQDRLINDFENYVELAFLRYRPARNWSIRAGRMNSDLYLLSEYPSVGNAYLWVRPPQEFYSFASINANFDGLDIEFSKNVQDGFFRVKLALGKATPKLTASGVASEIEFTDLVTLSASYQIGNMTLRGSHSSVRINEYRLAGFSEFVTALSAIPDVFWPNASELAIGLSAGGKNAQYSALGFIFENDTIVMHTELGLSSSDWLLVPDTLTGYFSLGYKLDNITLYSSFSGVRLNEAKVDFGEVFIPSTLPQESQQLILGLNETLVSILPNTVSHQNSISVGAKWFTTESVTLKAQIDHFKIFPYGGALWEYSDISQKAYEQSINVFSLSISTVF
jgi:hypothetical protein